MVERHLESSSSNKIANYWEMTRLCQNKSSPTGATRVIYENITLLYKKIPKDLKRVENEIIRTKFSPERY